MCFSWEFIVKVVCSNVRYRYRYRFFYFSCFFFLIYSPEIPFDLFVQFAFSLGLFVLIPLSRVPPPLLITNFISVWFFIKENKWTKNPSYAKYRMLVIFPIFYNYYQCTAFCLCIFIISEVYFQGKFLEVGLLCERTKWKHNVYRCTKVIFVGIGSFFPPTSNPCKYLFPKTFINSILKNIGIWDSPRLNKIVSVYVYICISLVLTEFEYLFLYLRTILYVFLWNIYSCFSYFSLMLFWSFILNF